MGKEPLLEGHGWREGSDLKRVDGINYWNMDIYNGRSTCIQEDALSRRCSPQYSKREKTSIKPMPRCHVGAEEARHVAGSSVYPQASFNRQFDCLLFTEEEASYPCLCVR